MMAGFGPRLALLVVCLVELTFGATSRGAIQYRISAEQFAEVAHALLAPPDGYITYSGDASINISTPHQSYKFRNVRIDQGVPMDVHISIPKDDCINISTTFTNMIVHSTLVITRQDENQTETETQLSLKLTEVDINVTSEGHVETLSVVGNHQEMVWLLQSCQATEVEFATDSLTLVIDLGFSQEEMQEIVKRMICNKFQLKFALGFGAIRPELGLEVIDTYIPTQVAYLQVKNNTILVTHTLLLSKDVNSMYDETNINDIIDGFPPIRNNSAPFEIWINGAIVDELWKLYKTEKKIGVSPIPLDTILPIIPYKDIDTGRVPYINQVYETFPDAVGNFWITDVDLTLNVSSGEMNMNLNLTGSFDVTLNCDPNRKYVAFTFHIFASVPMQIATDKKYLKFRFYGFDGNITILESNIGHISSRYLQAVFYVLPQILGPDVFEKKLNKKAKGLFIKEMLPNNLFLDEVAVALEKDHIVIGGQLFSEDPSVTPGTLNWVGDLSRVPDQIFPMYDNTPEDLEPLPRQDCEPPSTTPGVNSAPHLIGFSNCFVLIQTLQFCLYLYQI